MASNPEELENSEERKLDFFDHSSKSRRRKRTVFSKEQTNILVNYFAKNRYPGIEEREHLSSLLNIPESQVQIWFQNRRARYPIHPKKRALCLENKPPSPILEEDFSKQNFMTPSASSYVYWADEPGQEAGPKSSCFFERRSATLTTENACMDGYGISPNPHFISSQTMRPATEFQPGDLSRPVFQRSSMQWPFSWALKGTKGSENYDSCTSFCGEMKPPMQQQQQQQRCTKDQSYPCYHPVPFQYPQEPQHQLQQPYPQQHPILQQLTPSQHQSPQEFQGQTQVPPLVREKEQRKELLPSFKQQELNPVDLSKSTVGCGSTLFPHDGHLTSSMGDVAGPMGHVAVPQEAITAPQGHQTDHQGDVETLLGHLNAFLGEDLAISLGDVDNPLGHQIDS